MTVRTLRDSDVPILKAWAERSGFEYPELDHPHIESVLVVADEDDKPLVAVAAKRLVEVFCWLHPEAGTELRTEAIQMLHRAMTDALKRAGYDCAEAFLPPKVERRGFGRILRERFGWHRNWSSYGKRL